MFCFALKCCILIFLCVCVYICICRNQRMTEDQSVVGRRRIYYDQSCGEALICSDSEEDNIEDEEEKKEFGNVEDYILWLVLILLD